MKPDRSGRAADPLAGLLTIADVHTAAIEKLARGVADFLDGGADEERTLRENESAFDGLRLLPRVLRDVSQIELSTDVLGSTAALPILLGPAGAHRMFHPDGEVACAKAAAALGTGIVVSTGASTSLEEVARIGPALRWFQVYCYRDRSVTKSLLERAHHSGYKAICLTVDVPRHGRRLRNLRNGFVVPATVPRANFEGAHRESSGKRGDLADFVRETYDASLSWSDLAWFASVSGLPIVLKGVLSAEDAVLAAEAGVAAIVVSNHGGRQLDGVPATIDALPRIRAAVGGRLELYLDGGVRRGTDVIKALALGANAVFVVRPYLWGLAVAGEAGVRHVVELLREELELAMSLVGAKSPAELSSSSVSHVGGLPT
jgi:isopentenyl diphosphate isomerase/L-lactate dehydrogenase-like FMN-dependent dehydrogenase